MSVRHGLLALLAQGPMHGYELRARFEESTGGTLNVGQVYSTLSRLERDDLVEPLDENDAGQRPYAITAHGRRELATWFDTPVESTARTRDELAVKLALALATPGVDVTAVIQRQKSAAVLSLQQYTRLMPQTVERPSELAWRLVLDGILFQIEAEIRWLDHCEASVVRYAPSPRVGAPEPAPRRRARSAR